VKFHVISVLFLLTSPNFVQIGPRPFEINTRPSFRDLSKPTESFA